MVKSHGWIFQQKPQRFTQTLELPMKMMKTIGIVLLASFLALLVSAFSMGVRVGTDAVEKETIGIQTKWGFPVWYKTTAPGLAWAQFSGARFAVNAGVWFVVITSVLLGVRSKRRNRSSNQAVHAIGASAPQHDG